MYIWVAVAALLVGVGIGVALARRRPGASDPVLGSAPPRGTGAPLTPSNLPGLVVEALGEGVVVVDRGDDVLLANPAARSLGALIGDRLAGDELRMMAYDALDSADVRQGTISLRRGFLGREIVNVGVAAVPIRPVGSGRVLAVALLLSDLTESHRLEAVRRDFVANVSHELKTPVGALSLLAEAVQEARDDPEQVARFADRMQRESQRLGRLVGELIALSRVQGADALPDMEPVLVEDIIDEAMDRTRTAANKVGITLMSTVTSGLQVRGNEDQLISAVENLVENAVSYSPDGTKVVLTGRTVENSHDFPGHSWVEIAVTDQGIGIADTDLDRIFERFYRVDPARSRATGGTGLGLSIVKHVVTNHGGSVDAWSSEGSGSTFTIRLPVLAGADEVYGLGDYGPSGNDAGGYGRGAGSRGDTGTTEHRTDGPRATSADHGRPPVPEPLADSIPKGIR